MTIEFHEAEALLTHILDGNPLEGVVCQNLDLRACSAQILTVSAAGAAFLGCRFEDHALTHILKTGGIVFPELPGLPYRPYRSSLYTIDELMEGYRRGDPGSFGRDALDMSIYQHFIRYRQEKQSPPLLEALAQRLHDHAIDDALEELLSTHPRIVAIMGGHRLARGERAYRAVARIAHSLTGRGYFIATGGGPGAMEAGNLGAYMTRCQEDELQAAIDELATAPSYHDSDYLEVGFNVRDRFAQGGESLAIPTWFYGHEPTNPFASHIAKYFANSLREDVLLAMATSGVVFAPGSAGTIQEVFMDAAQNHYGSFKLVSPMVFYDTRFWTETSPVYPVLETLAENKQYRELIALFDDPEDIVHFIESHPAVPFDPAFTRNALSL